MSNLLPLSRLDHRILWQLDFNARRNLSQLARELGVSKQVLSYRIKRLEEGQVIVGYRAIVDIHRLGFFSHRIFLRYGSISPSEEQKFIRFLVKHDLTLFVQATTGRWDLEIVFAARNFIHFNNLFDAIKLEWGDFFGNYTINMTPVTYLFTRDYLVAGRRARFNPMYYGFEPTQRVFDPLEIGLITELSANCLQTYEELGERLKTTPRTVKERMVKLKKEGVFTRYVAMLNRSALHREQYKVMFSIKHLSHEDEQKLYRFCAEDNQVVYLIKVVGAWQMEIEVEVPSQDELTRFLHKLRSSFHKILFDYEILYFDVEHKLNYFPMAARFFDYLKVEKHSLPEG